MKYIYEIYGKWTAQEVLSLEKELNVKIGLYSFYIEEDYLLRLKQLLKDKQYDIHQYAIFSKEDIFQADYCNLSDFYSCGYPKPDHDFGYMNLTYDLTDYCEECGVGKVQKDAFRISKVAKHKMFGLGWVYDELFVYKDVYESIFKPFGIDCREVKRYWQEYTIDSIVQLVIPETDEPLYFPECFEREICPKCNIPKYTPHIVDFFPLHKNPIAPIYKGAEYFGSGYEARKNIYVSAKLRDILIKNKLAKYFFFTPCKNP